ncbi:MerR family transcriptional regulator [Actinomadura luteofluorescens]|uniref:MerR family transcriptional regulator n=1 Tax=Actinomadura luteofluorescens TaxID=46163 RepID=UPI002164AF54|nr:MerR family transcriptional regulator [Actinomadura glauciflava]MCR3745113.1 DNA-binding transcriptional regulator, MerR family [Actinomadura glauciflava]
MLIGELSRRTGVSPRLLRYYEEQGLLQAERGSNGYRRYGDDSVLTVRKIRVLLDAGLTSEVIRQVLPCTRSDQPDFDWCAGIRDLLDRELTALNARIEGLQRNHETLTGFLGRQSAPE